MVFYDDLMNALLHFFTFRIWYYYSINFLFFLPLPIFFFLLYLAFIELFTIEDGGGVTTNSGGSSYWLAFTYFSCLDTFFLMLRILHSLDITREHSLFSF